MGYTASVSNDIQAFVSAFQIFININFHIIELNLHTIEEGVIISCPGSDFIQSINHFNDSVKDTFRENKTQITGSSCESRSYHTFFDTCNRTPSSAHQIAETLYDHTAAQHIGKTGNAFAISITVFKWLREMFGYQQCEVCIFCLFGRIFIAVAVCCDNAVCIFVYNDAIRIHTESPHIIFEFFCSVDNLTLIQFVCQV